MKKKIDRGLIPYIILMVVIFVGLTFTAVLYLTSVTSWSWITGYIIGNLAFISLIPLITYSIKILVKTENVYLYLLLFLIRIGVIFVPFLFPIYLPNQFSVFGILIALVPFGSYYLYKNFVGQKGNYKGKGGN